MIIQDLTGYWPKEEFFFFLIDPMKSLNEHNELQVLTQPRPNMFELCEVEIPKWFELSTNRQIGHQDMLHAWLPWPISCSSDQNIVLIPTINRNLVSLFPFLVVFPSFSWELQLCNLNVIYTWIIFVEATMFITWCILLFVLILAFHV